MDRDPRELIEYALENLPALGRVDAKIVMYDQYETRYGIYDHLTPRPSTEVRPLASVAMHPSENFTEGGIMYDSLLNYAEKNYKEIWGLNLTEFLNLPCYMTKMLREITDMVHEKKNKAIEIAEQDLKASIQGS